MDDLEASLDILSLNKKPSVALERTWSTLCNRCRAIFSEDRKAEEESDGLLHHSKASDCYQAAEDGCPICNTVWLRATHYGNLDVLSVDMKKFQFSTFSIKRNSELLLKHTRWPGDCLVLQVSIRNLNLARGLGIARSFASDSVLFALQPASLHPTLLTSEVVSDETSSKETWKLLESWMTRCREDCGCMSRPKMELCLSRILDVGDVDDSKIHLRSKDQLDAEITYVTLSHCWGNTMVCQIYDPELEWQGQDSGITLDAARSGIEVSTLPKTFRDAVEVTRRLGLKYLWIDSLCIIQNSKVDWKEESKNMGTLYANAYLTLAADGAMNSREGLFHHRNAALVSPIVVQDTRFGELLGETVAVVLPADFWRETVSDTALGRRAWYLQERILSQAIIHFGKKQVAWECFSSDFCETFPHGLPDILGDGDTRFISLSEEHGKALRLANRPATGSQNIELESTEEAQIGSSEVKGLEAHDIGQRSNVKGAIEKDKDHTPSNEIQEVSTVNDNGREDLDESLDKYYIWSRIIEKYCRTDITFDSDRLIAIYGSALVVGVLILHDFYIGGLWMNILPSQLVWSVDAGMRNVLFRTHGVGMLRSSSRPPGRRPDTRVAPSWSWASVKGPVLMPTPLRTGYLIQPYIFGIKSLNDLGFHENAFLAVRGNLHLASLAWYERLNCWGVWMWPDGIGNTVITEDNGILRSPDRGYASIQLVEDDPLSEESESKFASVPTPDDAGVLFGVAQPDCSDDVMETENEADGYSVLHPVLCMPVIDTRKSPKNALLPSNHVMQLNGVSGLILQPVGVPEVQGLYKRIGVFSLIGHEPANLRVRPGTARVRHLFSSIPGNDSDRVIILG